MDVENKKRYIDDLLNGIFELDEPAVDRGQEREIRDLITRVINGDTPKKHLIINIDQRAIVYILTDARMIKIEIDIEDKKMLSLIFALSDITRIETETKIGEGTIRTQVIFDKSALGLVYQMDDENAVDFFQALDEVRVKRK